MRFLIVDSYYPDFLRSVYTQHSRWDLKSYAKPMAGIDVGGLWNRQLLFG